MAKKKTGKKKKSAKPRAEKKKGAPGAPAPTTPPLDPARDAEVLKLIDQVLELEPEIAALKDTVEALKDDLKGAKDRLAAEQEKKRKIFEHAMALRAGKPYQADFFDGTPPTKILGGGGGDAELHPEEEDVAAVRATFETIDPGDVMTREQVAALAYSPVDANRAEVLARIRSCLDKLMDAGVIRRKAEGYTFAEPTGKES